ncbi:MAG: hypothetical protein FD129_3165, partial [bacterium]
TAGAALPSGVYFARLVASGVAADPVKLTIAR